MVSEPAGHADGRQPADVADAANGIGKGEGFIQIRVQLRGSDGKRRGNQYVDVIKYLVHFLLEDAANALRQNEVGCADLLTDVTADFPQRIVEFGYASRLNQRP